MGADPLRQPRARAGPLRGAGGHAATAAPQLTPARLSAADFDAAVPAPAELLAAAVADGASLGFRNPSSPAEAADRWQAQRSAVTAGDLPVWTARRRRRPVGLDGPPPPATCRSGWPVAAGDLPVWTARRQDGALAGSVGLALTRKANGTHRAEIVKLMVHPG
ncbi:hypothetical protein [Kitasatospora acidiphila]|uniref:hypothetical protein n=1 Tax=Kitasatospora acidiphila TaxID=2567942 RepID=UPI003C795C25